MAQRTLLQEVERLNRESQQAVECRNREWREFEAAERSWERRQLLIGFLMALLASVVALVGASWLGLL